MDNSQNTLQGGDTETTGLSPKDDRVVEVALMDFDPVTGVSNADECLHLYFNPEKEQKAETVAVHGLTNEFLAEQPLFKEHRDELIARLENRTLVAHNAKFDVMMLEAEFKRSKVRGAPQVTFESLNCKVIDTLPMARLYVQTKSGLYKLDDLLVHFNLPATGREQFHGALVDVALLATVYPHIMRSRAHRVNTVSQNFSFHMDDEIAPQDTREIVRRIMEIEQLTTFLDKEKERLAAFYETVNGRVAWSDGEFSVSATPGAPRIDWAKVREALLKDVDLVPYQGATPKATLKFRTADSA